MLWLMVQFIVPGTSGEKVLFVRWYWSAENWRQHATGVWSLLTSLCCCCFDFASLHKLKSFYSGLNGFDCFISFLHYIPPLSCFDASHGWSSPLQFYRGAVAAAESLRSEKKKPQVCKYGCFERIIPNLINHLNKGTFQDLRSWFVWGKKKKGSNVQEKCSDD